MWPRQALSLLVCILGLLWIFLVHLNPRFAPCLLDELNSGFALLVGLNSEFPLCFLIGLNSGFALCSLVGLNS